MSACQAITFYHSCGCKSNKDLVYFCTTPNCQHEASNLVVGGLPFACGSQQGRSEACKVEDKAKKEFVREVDTADKLQELMVLPECTKEDITALVSPWTGSLTPDGEFYSHYRRRHAAESDDSPSKEAPPFSINSSTEEADVEKVGQELWGHSKVGDEANRSSEDTKVGSSLQDEQEEYNGDIKGDSLEDELFVIGDEDDGDEFVDVELDDDYDIYEDVDIDKNLESYGEHEGKANVEDDLQSNIEKDTQHTTHGSMSNAEVSANVAEYTTETCTTEKEKQRNMSILPYTGAVEAFRSTFSPVHDRFGEMEMTDDVIDFLIATKESEPSEPNEPERKKTAVERFWSCFSMYK
ncbi:uncharacterized protein GGS22DRAFT_197445 [Annulohypoxylon maeteangense]|uniref:uncharacterized protein n=1 Tax=Annulohypoxylon maeteangense TaxID=1927788 RepID=UPI0020084CD6|nr:uncharacterized protein GGS22DRAFT_197445 [Annulohypoxylon maeteangense]KAI0880516.1 hypothetical protein GGS22DRAFT_197445 [Annulohypoxylon maeteangense]